MYFMLSARAAKLYLNDLLVHEQRTRSQKVYAACRCACLDGCAFVRICVFLKVYTMVLQ